MMCLKVTVKIITGHIKLSLGTPLCKNIDTTPQYRFNAPRVKCCEKHHEHVS
jgi:hypothetical protein